jgi:hypothetical protein
MSQPMKMDAVQSKTVIFRYMPVRNVEVAKTLRIKGRGDGVVKGILTDSYQYLTRVGESAPIEDIFRVCLQFLDEKDGACLNPTHPTDFFLVRGWGTYLPQDSKELPWRELR